MGFSPLPCWMMSCVQNCDWQSWTVLVYQSIHDRNIVRGVLGYVNKDFKIKYRSSVTDLTNFDAESIYLVFSVNQLSKLLVKVVRGMEITVKYVVRSVIFR